MAGITCCYQCPDRQPSCHGTCERYLQQKAQWEEDKKKHKASLNPIIHEGCFSGDSGFRKSINGRKIRK